MQVYESRAARNVQRLVYKNYQENFHVQTFVNFRTVHEERIPIYLLHISSNV